MEDIYMSIKSAENLKKKIDKIEREREDYRSVTLSGIKNLSASDLGTIELYIDNYLVTGGYSFNGLMEPRGDIKKVLDKNDVIDNMSNTLGW